MTVISSRNPFNPPMTQTDTSAGYRYEARQPRVEGKTSDTLVILAFSGGGTRAAAISYGVLESLKRTEALVHRLLKDIGPQVVPDSRAADSAAAATGK